jgi:hypothetical protein
MKGFGKAVDFENVQIASDFMEKSQFITLDSI